MLSTLLRYKTINKAEHITVSFKTLRKPRVHAFISGHSTPLHYIITAYPYYGYK